MERIPMDNKENKEKIVNIPEEEIKFSFARSSGPGGQNVNKRDTKVIGVWNIEASQVLTPEQKVLILQHLRAKMNQEGDIIVYSQNHRSQSQNKEEVIKKLNNLINQALQPRKARFRTKVPRSEKRKRLENKKRQSEKKRLRKGIRF